MKYYSTNNREQIVSLEEAVIKGLAPDKGLYMPENIKRLPDAFYHNIENLTLQEIAFVVAEALFDEEDIDSATLKSIVYEAMNFDIPLVKVNDSILSLELFHGPTAAFKDVGARFMARLLGYFISKNNTRKENVNVLVATSGDTGSAVANGFYEVPGVKVFVLYPKGKVSEIQEKQFTTLGKNIISLEIDGTFDDCQRLVKEAFMDKELNEKLFITSANSINVARFLPQSFYYFYAYAQYKRMGYTDKPVFCVPSGNFGNLTAGLIAQRMGLPIKQFIAANNRNDIFLNYLKTGIYEPKMAVQTIANAMDVGDPSNFARILDLYDNSHEAISQAISGFSFSDEQIRHTLAHVFETEHYLLDPHGACAYQALSDSLKPGEHGILLETAHPAKFLEVVESIIGSDVEIPDMLKKFLNRMKHSVELNDSYVGFREFLLKQ